MEHIYHKGDSNRPIYLLFHGTGGNEHDLVPIKHKIDPNAGYISFRGDVNEHGALRFFKRIKPGLFDEEDLIKRTYSMIERIKLLSKQYQFSLKQVIALGYSNGANLIASMLFHDNTLFKRVVLYHPMIPIKNLGLPPQKDLQLLIGAGINDPIVPKQEVKTLVSMFKASEATLKVHWTNQGHHITEELVLETQRWVEMTCKKETN